MMRKLSYRKDIKAGACVQSEPFLLHIKGSACDVKDIATRPAARAIPRKVAMVFLPGFSNGPSAFWCGKDVMGAARLSPDFSLSPLPVDRNFLF
jgi:hypothetical protein